MSDGRIIPPPSGPPAVRSAPIEQPAPQLTATSPCGLSFPEPSPQRADVPAAPHSPEEELTP